MLIQILNGIVYGGLLYLLAVGLVLIFGLREVVNFAHGALFMVGAYLGFSIAAMGYWWGGLLVSVVAMAIVGCLLDAMVFSTLRKQDHIVTVLVTFGILLILETVVTKVWGKAYLTYPVPPLLAGTINIGGSPFPVYRLFVIAVSVAVAVSLSVWLRYTRTGLYIRAASTDARVTSMQGINVDRLSLIVVGLGTALAGLSGVVAGPLLSLSPTMGNYILIDSFIVVVIGGLGSFAGAFVAALLIGQIHNFGAVYLPWAATVLPFMLMVGILIWRPTGFAGSRT
ncbi:ABC transporter permease [Pseudolabrys sp. Root1462]|jgi:branched-chain amino acid transport system permease protein|uniref:branched-chain amino acid ABC transporter permease n=1 Tax=Pseudolabrys sp. Root1462 TaxID=1736466 RepID=UPI000702B323|nr:branched-chain amino acid ABC transporter permease [Pseudolabrys sp. Root1462]KQZ01549.1 ABC transporter permease [Pseudolabrys sp. Root1462]